MDTIVTIIIHFIQPHLIGRSCKVLTGRRAINQIITTVEKSAYKQVPRSPSGQFLQHKRIRSISTPTKMGC